MSCRLQNTKARCLDVGIPKAPVPLPAEIGSMAEGEWPLTPPEMISTAGKKPQERLALLEKDDSVGPKVALLLMQQVSISSPSVAGTFT
jgi:hypothetical protein